MTTTPPIQSIVKRNGTIVAYDRNRIRLAIFKATVSTGKPDLALAENMALAVENALVSAYPSGMIPTVEDIQDIVEQTLIENRLARLARNYIIYRHERAMIRSAKSFSFEVADNIPYRKIYEVLLWNMSHDCHTVEGLNEIIDSGRFPELVAQSEQRYEEELDTGSRRILERIPEVRVVIIAGPSSSGKTSALIKLSERLARAGIGLRALNIDNYFFDLVQHPRDEFGDYDYESPQSLDIDLINTHLIRLLAGETIRTPRYDFKTGRRTLEATEVCLGANEVLLIDSLHGLYEPMTAGVEANRKFRLYVETLGQLKAPDGSFMRWADNRLLRRMIRDRHYRNSQPMETLTHWHYVRRGELKFIIPFIKDVDFLLNTALPYELPILRHRLFAYFPDAIQRFANDPNRQDACVRARRVHDLLAPMREVGDDAPVPPASPFREFIGGSSYPY